MIESYLAGILPKSRILQKQSLGGDHGKEEPVGQLQGGGDGVGGQHTTCGEDSGTHHQADLTAQREHNRIFS